MSGYYIRTEEHKELMRQAMLGKKHTDDTKKKMSLSKLGKPSKLRGSHRPKEIVDKCRLANIGRKASVETRQKMSLSHKGQYHWWWVGRKHSYETKNKMSLKQRGSSKILSKEAKEKLIARNKANIPSIEAREKTRQRTLGNKFALGYKHSEDDRLKTSLRQIGEKNHNWLGGLSFEPYASLFNKQLKELIRVRDGYTCQKCGIPEVENNVKLSIHHIDYDKKDCLPSNLISLCKKCHSKVNHKRKYWESYFTSIMIQREYI